MLIDFFRHLENTDCYFVTILIDQHDKVCIKALDFCIEMSSKEDFLAVVE